MFTDVFLVVDCVGFCCSDNVVTLIADGASVELLLC